MLPKAFFNRFVLVSMSSFILRNFKKPEICVYVEKAVRVIINVEKFNHDLSFMLFKVLFM